MAKRLDYLALLQERIQRTHQCEAVYRGSVHVHETIEGQTIWKGDVEVFQLNGHAEAKKCYAWIATEKGKSAQLVTILGKPPVNSPAMAVKSAIFFNAQPTPYLDPNLASREEPDSYPTQK